MTMKSLSKLLCYFVLTCNLLLFKSPCSVIASSSSSSLPPTDCFGAAAYEHILQGYSFTGTTDLQVAIDALNVNLQAYVDATEKASVEGADLIVFPEDGLHNIYRVTNTGRDVARMFGEEIPDAVNLVNPCLDANYSQSKILHTLSCAALENKIYLVANMADVIKCQGQVTCPSDGVYLHNSQVAFDRNGTVIAKYHKQHLFGEEWFDTPVEQELVYFDTDFGARIGLHICFDRVFHDPMIKLVEEYNVTTMALSSWWFDGYPFLLSHQIDQYQARRLGINIIHACAKNLPSGTTGSGLYSPNYVANVEHDLNIDGGIRYSRLLISQMPIDPSKGSHCHSDNLKYKMADYTVNHGIKYSMETVKAFASNFSTFESVQLNESMATSVSVCNGNLCCSLDYEKKNVTHKDKSHKDFYSKKLNLISPADTKYIFAAVNGLRDFMVPKYSAYEQACLIMAVDPVTGQPIMDTGAKFKLITIKGNFESKYVYPTALSEHLHLVKNKEVTFDAIGNTVIVQSKKPILMAGLYGRVYEKDIDETPGDTMRKGVTK